MSKRQRRRTRVWPGPLAQGHRPEPTDPAPHRTRLGNGDVQWADDGHADSEQLPALTIHGIPGSLRDWRYLGPAMAARGRRCVRLDLPGFAGSDRQTWDTYAPRNRAGFFPAFADALAIDRFLLIAHSFGGGLALMTAALFPDRVAGLVLVNSLGTVRHRGLAPIQGRLFKNLPELIHHDVVGGPLGALLRQGYRKLGFKGDFSDRDMVHHLRLIQHMDFAEHRWAARTCRCPTLVISTDDDPLIEARVPHRLVTDLESTAMVRHLHLPDGGHYANKHHAHVIADEIVQLFD